MSVSEVKSETRVVKDELGARYEIILPAIGEGGQGKVYSAIGGRHAVKIIRQVMI